MTDTRIVPVEPTEEWINMVAYFAQCELDEARTWIKRVLNAAPVAQGNHDQHVEVVKPPPSQGPTEEEIERVIERTIGDLMPDRCVHTLNGDMVIYGERLSWPGVNLTKISEEAARAVQSLYTGRKP